MDASVSIPAVAAEPPNAALPQAGPFVFSNISGLRIAAVYQPGGGGAGIGRNLSVSILVARECQAHQNIGSLEDNQSDVTQYQGRGATLDITMAGVLSYQFNNIDFVWSETRELPVVNQMRRRVGLLTFRFSGAALEHNNTSPQGQSAVNLTWLGGVVAPPAGCGDFSIAMPQNVQAAANAAQRNAPAGIGNGGVQPLYSRSLAKTQVAANDTRGGVLSMACHRDGTNEWLNSLLVQNCGEAAPPAGGAGVEGGGLDLTIDGGAWTGTPITSGGGVSAYLVEETWGWFKHVPQIGNKDVVALGAAAFGNVQNWLEPNLNRIVSLPNHPIDLGVGHPGLERVNILFSSGLRANDTLFA
jgi:hypothetical protein